MQIKKKLIIISQHELTFNYILIFFSLDRVLINKNKIKIKHKKN